MTQARLKKSSPVTRRQVLVAGTAAAAVTVSARRSAYAQAATTPAIPEVTVRHAVVSYTNHAWTVLAAKKGFLKEVGITMDGGAPKVLRDQQMVPQLQNGEVDITTMYFGLITQALDKVTNIKPILAYS
jgi:ABC-type nitrate/sulfonate/bicarbonate transport system substrate-binding protein